MNPDIPINDEFKSFDAGLQFLGNIAPLETTVTIEKAKNHMCFLVKNPGTYCPIKRYISISNRPKILLLSHLIKCSHVQIFGGHKRIEGYFGGIVKNVGHFGAAKSGFF